MIRLNDAPSIYDFVSYFEKNNKVDKETLAKSNKNISMILRCFHLNLNCFFTCLCYAKLVFSELLFHIKSVGYIEIR